MSFLTYWSDGITNCVPTIHFASAHMKLFVDHYPTSGQHIVPRQNVGCLQDIPYGQYLYGVHGESILNGGLSDIEGICGRGNTFKTVLMKFKFLRVLDRYEPFVMEEYETEGSGSVDRTYQLAMQFPNLAGVDLEMENRLRFSSVRDQWGDEWFDKLRKFGEAKFKSAKTDQFTTPFRDKYTGEAIKTIRPTGALVDSLSQLNVATVDKIFDKAKVGEGAANVDSMKASAAKSQIMGQMPGVTGRYGIKIGLTAHIGDQIQIDAYVPPAQKLGFLKQKQGLKRVPENFTFLTHMLLFVIKATPLIHKDTKAPLYPADSEDNIEGDCDLMMLLVQVLRSKYGASGMPFEVVVSQAEGVLIGLTEFNYIKGFDRYGISGNDTTYNLDLVPDVSLRRTTIRGKINADVRLQRALEITSEMCQMKNLWGDSRFGEDEKDILCTPKELYDDLKAKGYDWDLILTQTRGYWIYEENEATHPLKFLSTKDLLRMRKGLYHPWWMEKLPTK